MCPTEGVGARLEGGADVSPGGSGEQRGPPWVYTIIYTYIPSSFIFSSPCIRSIYLIVCYLLQHRETRQKDVHIIIVISIFPHTRAGISIPRCFLRCARAPLLYYIFHSKEAEGPPHRGITAAAWNSREEFDRHLPHCDDASYAYRSPRKILSRESILYTAPFISYYIYFYFIIYTTMLLIEFI